MKKIILLLLLSLSLYSDAKTYIGLNYGVENEDFTTGDAKTSSQMFALKAGYGLREAYAVEIYLEYVQNRSKIFSSNPDVDYDGDKYSINVELVKAFDFNIYILPFIKVGFGSGFLKIDRTLDDKLSFGSFSAGSGFYLPINDNFDFEFGYKYKAVSYEALDLISTKIQHKSDLSSFYFGFNVRY